mmetsp:Transcript_75731/g.215671  ORF Transcript_75731/g.215671 Transcript_75731/m.215671 type:complete len:464 (+) Transcript_75731:119-1510(+)
MAEIMDCVTRAVLGTTHAEAAKAEAEAAEAAAGGRSWLSPGAATSATTGRAGRLAAEKGAAATETEGGYPLPRPRDVEAAGAESKRQWRALPTPEQRLSNTGNRGPAAANAASKQPAPVDRWGTVAGVRNDTSVAFMIFQDGSGPVALIPPSELVFTQEQGSKLMQAAYFAAKSPIFALQPNAKYDVYTLEPQHGMTNIMSWTGARARVDNQQHLVISNGHVGIISRGLALRRLQQHFRVRYTKTRTDAANVLSTWYRERYYARLFRRIDAANKIIGTLGAVVKERVVHKHRVMIKPCAFARGFVARLTKPCQICLENVQRCQFVTVHENMPLAAVGASVVGAEKHEFCRGCVKSFIQSSVEDGRLHIQCPAVSQRKLQSHCSLNDGLSGIYATRSLPAGLPISLSPPAPNESPTHSPFIIYVPPCAFAREVQMQHRAEGRELGFPVYKQDGCAARGESTEQT